MTIIVGIVFFLVACGTVNHAPRECIPSNYLQRDKSSIKVGDPIVISPAQYPRRALSWLQEGWAVVEFTVKKDGTVSNVVAIDVSPKLTDNPWNWKFKQSFEHAAIEHIKTAKFNSPTLNGQIIQVNNVRRVIHFAMPDQ